MTGDPGYSSAVIEVPPAEAAAGATKVVWSPVHGPLTVTIPPGTVDGAVLWVQSQTAGNVAVTVRVTSQFTPQPPFAGAPGPGSPPPYPGQPSPPGQPLPPGQASPPGQPPYPGQPSPYPGQASPYPGQASPYPGQPSPYPGQPSPYPGQPQTLAGPPQASPRTGRRNQVIGGTLVVLLALGCCGVIRLFTSGDDDKVADKPAGATETTATGEGAAPATSTPLTPVQYQQALAASDKAIGATFQKLNTSDSAAYAKAAPAAANTIRAEAAKLQATVAPAGASVVHDKLVTELESLGDMVTESATAKKDCPAASPWAGMLQSGWADGIRQDAKKLAATDPTYKFGTFLPAAPKEANRRLKNGTFVKRTSTGGSGHLKIKNGADDAAISLVPTKGKKPKPVLTVYVRGGKSFTAKGVRDGTYRIYTASGEDWDAGKKGFTRDCSFSKFDDTFKFTTTSVSSTIWTITMTPILGGNASTSDVDPNAFPS
jgi:hypothetical protein